MTSRVRRYAFEFGGAMAVYTVSILSMPTIVGWFEEDSTWLWVVALIPILSVVLVIVAIYRHYRRQDEMQQRIMGEAHFLAGMITIFLTFAYGFLEIYVGVPKLPTLIIMPGFFAVMGLSMPFVTRRYR